MKQQTDCPKFEDCSAPLCPLQPNTIDNGIWYPDEEICTAKKFQTLPWVKKQKAIARINAPNDRYFTVEMLKAIKRLTKSVEGIDPDIPLDKAKVAERRWIEGRNFVGDKQAKQTKKSGDKTSAKRSDLVAVGGISKQAKGGRK